MYLWINIINSTKNNIDYIFEKFTIKKIKKKDKEFEIYSITLLDKMITYPMIFYNYINIQILYKYNI